MDNSINLSGHLYSMNHPIFSSVYRTSLVLVTTFIFLFLINPPSINAAESDSNEQRLRHLEQQLRLMSAEIAALKKGVGKSNGVNDTDSEQDERLDELEEIVDDIGENIGSRAVVNAFEASSLDVGGFMHSTFTHVDGEDDSVSGFNRQIFELLVKANLNDDWSAFFAQAFIRQSEILFDDDGDGIVNEPGERRFPRFNIGAASPLVIGWANYRHNDLLNIQFGRFITPHGIINIEHFPAILLDPEQPQFLRPFGGQTIFPNFVNGLHLHGQNNIGNGGNYIKYNFYTSNFVGNGEDLVSGGRLSHTWEDLGLTVGGNFAHGERNSLIDSDYDMYGFDVHIDHGSFLWKSEIFFTDEDTGNDRLGYYLQPAWHINPQWTAFYRYDFLDNGGTTGDTVENMFGINYTPLSNIRLRGTITHRDFEAAGGATDANALIYQLSATLSF